MAESKTECNYEIDDILTSGDAYFSKLTNSIERAEHSIEIEFYIFEESNIGEIILDKLKSAVSRGVIVHLLVDGFGSLPHLEWITEKCLSYQIKFKVFHPIHKWFPFFHLNKRNHRKTVIIDGKMAFIGSINIASSHFGSQVKNPWKDLALMVKGHSIQVLRFVFFNAWDEENNKSNIFYRLSNHALPKLVITKLQENKLRVNTFLVMRFLLWRDLLRRIRSAKTRIWILNAYFIPHRTLLLSLVKASKSGVIVKIVLPKRSDVPIIKWAAPALYIYLLKQNIKIFEYSKTMLHTKTLLIDDWGLIGSHNLNYRSLIHDLETEAVVDGPVFIQKMEEYYIEIISQSKEVTITDINNLSWWDWAKCRFILLFRYFI